jgi:hypothetical protein
MRERDLIEGLQACLQEIESGIDPETALLKFPALSAELRPLVEFALQAKSEGEAARVSEALQKSSLNRALSHAYELRSTATIPASRIRLSLPRWAYGLGVALVLLLIVTSSALAFSDQALPGDVLYPVKLVAEKTRLILTRDDAAKLELQHQFDQERSEEVQDLILEERLVSVNLVGVLEEASANRWKVSGITVDISQAGQLPQGAQVGYEVIVDGQLLQDGSIRADSISLRIFRFSGKLTQMSAGHWTVGGIVVSVNSLTRITGNPQLGQLIQVEGVMIGDGRLAALALSSSAPFVERPDTATPVFTDDDHSGPGEDEPNPTEDQDATEAPEPTDDDDPIESPRPTRTAEPTRTPEPTETEESTKTPEPTEQDDDDHSTRTPRPTEEDDD